jgi:hypothetical protein
MIGLEFQGQLGNQLFQYAAARVQAERLGCGLVIEQSPPGRRAALSRLARRQLGHQIFQCFPSLQVHSASHWLGALKALSREAHDKIKSRIFPASFEPPRVPPVGAEAYDPRIWDVCSGTWLLGYFQSAKYFTGYEARIRAWYTPTDEIAARVHQLVSRLPESPEDMVAVHVRRGDYLSVRGKLGDEDTVWSLPRAYYERALAHFPPDAPIGLFSDDPTGAAALLPRKPTWTSLGNSAVVDLFLVASFRQAIIANSSFSWWAAWLNSKADRVIVAPEYHIGWYKRCWYPADIKVDGWIYV